MRISRLVCGAALFLFLGSGHPLSSKAQAGEPHTTTDWALKASLKYDTLCVINTLTGDPYYLRYYQSEYDHFNPLFTPEERESFRQLKAIIKDGAGGIISADLSLYFSSVHDETLEEMIQTAHDSSLMRAALMKTPYWSSDQWAVYETAKPQLEIALKALQRVGFPQYWEVNARPRIEKRIAELSATLPQYN